MSLTSIQAQKCKYDVDKTDQFSKESIKGMTNILWGNKMFNYLSMSTFNKGGAYEIEMGIVFGGVQNEHMEVDDVVQIALENGESLTLTPIERAAPKNTTYSTSILTIYVPRFEVDREVIEKLASSQITTVRVNLDKNYDFDFTKRYTKNCKKLKESMNCMLELSPAN